MMIRRQEGGGLAKMLLEEQFIMGCSGLSDEVRWICLELGLPDATKEDVDKNKVDDAIKDHHLRMMKLEMTTLRS